MVVRLRTVIPREEAHSPKALEDGKLLLDRPSLVFDFLLQALLISVVFKNMVEGSYSATSASVASSLQVNYAC
jgi:hypothetical protein